MPEEMILGIRICAEEVETDGLDAAEVTAVCGELARLKAVDYVNTTIGSMAGLGGSIHVVPPMELAHAYAAPKAGALRAAMGLPSLSPAASTSRRSPSGCWPLARRTCAV